MSIAESLLPEFDQEMATTRRVLERVPSDKGDWKPHLATAGKYSNEKTETLLAGFDGNAPNGRTAIAASKDADDRGFLA